LSQKQEVKLKITGDGRTVTGEGDAKAMERIARELFRK
jgi:hypothetical protein